VVTLRRLSREQDHETLREAIALARSFDELNIYAPFHMGTETRELEVSLEVDGLLFNGRIDLVGEDYVLDFKTGEVIPDVYALQLWAYAKASGKSTAYIAYLRAQEVHVLSQEEWIECEFRARQISASIQQHHYPATPEEILCSGCPYHNICEERHNRNSI
jgi:ATP-dependent helicase/nuclease subunit A